MNENVKAANRERLSEVVETALNSVKEIADINTVVGEPITTQGGTTIIPITSMSVGFVTGGVDNFGRQTPEHTQRLNFAGGGGTGVKIVPIGFLVVKPDGDVRFLGATAAHKSDKIDLILDVLERSPEFIKKIRNAFEKEKTEPAFKVAENGTDKKAIEEEKKN